MTYTGRGALGDVLTATTVNSEFQPPVSGGGYSTIEDEGSPLPPRSTINFVGAGVTATDSGTETVVTIPGSGSNNGVQTFHVADATGNEFMTGNVLGRLYAIAVVPVVTATITQMSFLVAQNNAGGTVGVGVYDQLGNRLAYSSLQAASLGGNTIVLNNGGPVVVVGGALYYFCIEANINAMAPISVQGASVYNPPGGQPPLAFFVPNSRAVDPSGFPPSIAAFFGQIGGDARKYWLLGN